MLLVEIVAGSEVFPPLEVPDSCNTVGDLREEIIAGLAFGGDKFLQNALLQQLQTVGPRLTFHELKGGPVLAPTATFPEPPAKLHVDGPTIAVRSLSMALRRKLNVPMSARGATAPGSAGSSVLRRNVATPRAGTASRPSRRGLGRQTDEAAAVLDGEAAAAVLHYWFEELTTDDWFRQSHMLDDHIRKEFGALHARAAAGELSGWMARPDTCLALVVLLDQFSRNLYRGTAAAYACDAAARAAANAALSRGDDKNHWHPGPKRSALYLPFMHSEDLADKTRCVNLMREGLHESSLFSNTVNASANAGKAGQGTAPGNALPKLTGAPSAWGPNPGKEKEKEKEKEKAKQPPRQSKFVHSGKKATKEQTGQGQGLQASENWDDKGAESEEDSESSTSSDEGALKGVFSQVSTPGQGVESGQHGTKPAGAAEFQGRNANAYSMQAAAEMPNLPVLTLNHAHAQRFRGMRLDAQTQQAYLRDRKDVLRVVRYQCLVCSVTHEFRMCKGAAGAEHQHL